MSFDRRRLVGTWQLMRWSITYEDGSVTEPFGPGAEGLLIYTSDGWMSAALMANGRPRLSRSDARAAPVEERAAAFDSFFAYCGRWRVVDRSVEHTVMVAHNPALVGTVQVRGIRMRGPQLTLSAQESVPGGARVHQIQWRRSAGAARARKSKSSPSTAGARRSKA